MKLREVAEYCVKDTLLPHRLLKKLYTPESLRDGKGDVGSAAFLSKGSNKSRFSVN